MQRWKREWIAVNRFRHCVKSIPKELYTASDEERNGKNIRTDFLFPIPVAASEKSHIFRQLRERSMKYIHITEISYM